MKSIGAMAGARQPGDEADAVHFQRTQVAEVRDFADDANVEIALAFVVGLDRGLFLRIDAAGQENQAQRRHRQESQHGRSLDTESS